MLLLFSEDNEVVEVVVVVEREAMVVLEPFSPEQGVSDWGSVLMRSPKALRASGPVDTAPSTGRGLFSGLLIMQALLASLPRSVLREEAGQV